MNRVSKVTPANSRHNTGHTPSWCTVDQTQLTQARTLANRTKTHQHPQHQVLAVAWHLGVAHPGFHGHSTVRRHKSPIDQRPPHRHQQALRTAHWSVIQFVSNPSRANCVEVFIMKPLHLKLAVVTAQVLKVSREHVQPAGCLTWNVLRNLATSMKSV